MLLRSVIQDGIMAKVDLVGLNVVITLSNLGIIFVAIKTGACWPSALLSTKCWHPRKLNSKKLHMLSQTSSNMLVPVMSKRDVTRIVS